MQYLHQSRYGHIGSVHTAKPIMAMDKEHVYGITGGRADLSKPLYRIVDNRAYATEHHPGGVSPHAVFEIRGDKVHTTAHHPQHDPSNHVFEIKGMMT